MRQKSNGTYTYAHMDTHTGCHIKHQGQIYSNVILKLLKPHSANFPTDLGKIFCLDQQEINFQVRFFTSTTTVMKTTQVFSSNL